MLQPNGYGVDDKVSIYSNESKAIPFECSTVCLRLLKYLQYTMARSHTYTQFILILLSITLFRNDGMSVCVCVFLYYQTLVIYRITSKEKYLLCCGDTRIEDFVISTRWILTFWMLFSKLTVSGCLAARFFFFLLQQKFYFKGFTNLFGKFAHYMFYNLDYSITDNKQQKVKFEGFYIPSKSKV